MRRKLPNMNVRSSFYLFSILALAACISQKPAPVTHYGTAAGEGSAGVHTVTPGENLWSISQRYDIVMRDIVLVNDLRAPFILRSGQRIELPAPRTYRVRSGDSLYSVARIFEVSQSELARLNHINPPYVIQPGQVLKLPSVKEEREEMPVRLASARSPDVRPPTQQQTVQPSKKPAVKRPQASKAAKAKIKAKTPKRSSSKFLQPVDGKVISSYGPKKGGLHNDGINIKAPRGTPVKAAENGVVVYAGSELKGSGNLVLVRHSDRWMTAYAHMDKMSVKRGQVIQRGAKLGTVGSTGSVDTPQLHFEVRRGTNAVNPKKYL